MRIDAVGHSLIDCYQAIFELRAQLGQCFCNGCLQNLLPDLGKDGIFLAPPGVADQIGGQVNDFGSKLLTVSGFVLIRRARRDLEIGETHQSSFLDLGFLSKPCGAHTLPLGVGVAPILFM